MLSEPIKVRIKFSKKGRLKFISHLDLQRFFSLLLARADFPVKFTEGFNPHAKLIFTPPLSLGAESECEYLDTRADREISFEETMAALNLASVPEIEVLDVYYPQTKLSDIAFAKYTLEFEDAPDFSPLEKDELFVTKKSKSKTVDTDIKPMIKSFTCGDKKLDCTLDASGSSYLNPEYIARAVNISGGEYQITRTGFLTEDGKAFR